MSARHPLLACALWFAIPCLPALECTQIEGAWIQDLAAQIAEIERRGALAGAATEAIRSICMQTTWSYHHAGAFRLEIAPATASLRLVDPEQPAGGGMPFAQMTIARWHSVSASTATSALLIRSERGPDDAVVSRTLYWQHADGVLLMAPGPSAPPQTFRRLP